MTPQASDAARLIGPLHACCLVNCADAEIDERAKVALGWVECQRPVGTTIHSLSDAERLEVRQRRRGKLNPQSRIRLIFVDTSGSKTCHRGVKRRIDHIDSPSVA